MILTKPCDCCGRKIEKRNNIKFCDKCRLYVIPLKLKIHSLEYKMRQKNKIIYGVVDGRIKARLKKEDEFKIYSKNS